MIAFISSFLLTFMFAPVFIKFLKKFQFGQSIREEGPQSHQHKNGTPTLGGLIFLIPIFIFSLISIDFTYELFVLLFLTIGFGLIGFLDDFIKIYYKRNLGLTSKQKLILQSILSFIVYFVLISNDFDTHVYIPATNISLEFGSFYILFFLFFAIGSSNATNLTDGLDGLLTGTSIIAISAFSFISYQLNFIDIALFGTIFIGSLLAFLFFNFNPAKVFMGDTGSLAIGGCLVAISVLTKTEILLALIGVVYVIETLSVIIQVLYFKKTRKRIFKMTPIHHHFELSGWSERKVVLNFWLVGFTFAAFSIFLY